MVYVSDQRELYHYNEIKFVSSPGGRVEIMNDAKDTKTEILMVKQAPSHRTSPYTFPSLPKVHWNLVGRLILHTLSPTSKDPKPEDSHSGLLRRIILGP